ncbi:hypothetical protein [Rhizobium grahamii]|uniref:hypothetical protein n=1 Tax=Rhizobium grahamii TaxID=1120045 RepID=UPI00167B0C5C|nr:hypothetical protein [Rhizobium grahamii]
MIIKQGPSQTKTYWPTLSVAFLDQTALTRKNLTDRSRLFSPAIARLTPLTIVEMGFFNRPYSSFCWLH